MDFYQNHIARALPVVMRNECSEWPMKKKLDEVKHNETLYHNYLLDIFAGDNTLDQFMKTQTDKDKAKIESSYLISKVLDHAKKIRYIELGPRMNQSHEFREGYHKSVNKTGPY